MNRCVTASVDEERDVPRTLQIRDVDDEVYAGLVRHAADAGITVPELLRRHATRLAARPTTNEWLERTRRRSSSSSRAEVIEALDELRGAWPDAGR
jgi:antitoxin FitA